MNDYYKSIEGGWFDFEEFYNDIAHKLPDNAMIAEVGTGNGASIIYLASKLDELGKGYTAYGIDNLEYGGAAQMNTILNHFDACNTKNKLLLITKDSLAASLDFSDDIFDFIFIDSSHLYEMTKAELRLWWFKLKLNGLIGFHDYFSAGDVTKAVDECASNSIIQLYSTTKGCGVALLKRNKDEFRNSI